MTNQSAFKNTKPSDFNASRMAFFQALEDNFVLFRAMNMIPVATTLPELLQTNMSLFSKFVGEFDLFPGNRDLDIYSLLLDEGVSLVTITELINKQELDEYLHIEDEFYGSSIGSIVTRLPYKSQSRRIEEMRRLFSTLDQRHYYDRNASEKHQLAGFFKFTAFNFLRSNPSLSFENFNKWTTHEEMANLLRTDGVLSESLARTAIETLMGKHRNFDPYRSYHPLNTDCPLPNATGKEELAQILISSLVYDKGAIMHLTGVDANAKWRVLKVLAEVIAEHLSDDSERVAKMASQMVINALAIFEDGLPEKAHRHEIYGGFRETDNNSRLEDWIYAGPLQAHRTEPLGSFDTTESFTHLIDCLAEFYGPLNPDEVLSSHLVQMPVIGEISNLYRIEGFERYIQTMPDSAFINMRWTLRLPYQWKAHQATLVRSALLLQDYEQKFPGEDLPRANRFFAFRPSDEVDQRLMLQALCSQGAPSLELMKACRIGQAVMREHLQLLDDSVKEHILGTDLGL